jgi:hypothetical protein
MVTSWLAGGVPSAMGTTLAVVASGWSLCLVLACVPAPTASPIDMANVTELELPSGAWAYPVWLDDEAVLVTRQPSLEPQGRPFDPEQIFRYDMASRQMTPVEIDHPVDCVDPSHQGWQLLGDGRLGTELSCLSTTTLLAFDPVTNDTEVLVELGRNATGYTWNPALTDGLYSAGSGICEGILGMDRSVDAKPVDLVIRSGGKSFRVDAVFQPQYASGQCADTGRATGPAWSPDGSLIAFWASPASIGVADFARLDQPDNLYLVAPGENDPVEHVRNFYHPGNPAWSPDGSMLVLSGQMGEDEGTWLYEPATNQLVPIAKTAFGDLSWAPDGERIVGIVGRLDIATSGFTSTVVIVEVGASPIPVDNSTKVGERR